MNQKIKGKTATLNSPGVVSREVEVEKLAKKDGVDIVNYTNILQMQGKATIY